MLKADSSRSQSPTWSNVEWPNTLEILSSWMRSAKAFRTGLYSAGGCPGLAHNPHRAPSRTHHRQSARGKLSRCPLDLAESNGHHPPRTVVRPEYGLVTDQVALLRGWPRGMPYSLCERSMWKGRGVSNNISVEDGIARRRQCSITKWRTGSQPLCDASDRHLMTNVMPPAAIGQTTHGIPLSGQFVPKVAGIVVTLKTTQFTVD